MHRTVALIAALTLVVGLGACSGSDDDSSDAGTTLPDLELTSLDGGEPLALDDLGDGPVVINLWATWCRPCREEMPAFDEVARQVDGDVRIVGVNIGDDADDARAFVEDVAVGFPQYLDEASELHADLGATGMPTTVFVDGGEVLDVHPGELSGAELTAEIEDRFGVEAGAATG